MHKKMAQIKICRYPPPPSTPWQSLVSSLLPFALFPSSRLCLLVPEALA